MSDSTILAGGETGSSLSADLGFLCGLLSRSPGERDLEFTAHQDRRVSVARVESQNSGQDAQSRLTHRLSECLATVMAVYSVGIRRPLTLAVPLCKLYSTHTIAFNTIISGAYTDCSEHIHVNTSIIVQVD